MLLASKHIKHKDKVTWLSSASWVKWTDLILTDLYYFYIYYLLFYNIMSLVLRYKFFGNSVQSMLCRLKWYWNLKKCVWNLGRSSLLCLPRYVHFYLLCWSRKTWTVVILKIKHTSLLTYLPSHFFLFFWSVHFFFSSFELVK